ncbi:MAG: glycosyltransferase family 2 protein [Chloroflexi bacterium]|nr:glycosyltransferase family 2 protein [Chloroflexota bacterium]
MDLRCSVIIPNYSGLRFLRTCLDALQAQSYPRELTEVILVDDASTDDSVMFVQANYPQVHIVPMPRNSGLAAACNAGATAAMGDLLVMLNNDTEVEPGWLAALAEAALAHPQAGAVASKMLLFDRRDTLHNAGDIMAANGIPRNRGVWEVDRGQYDDELTIFGGCGGGVAYRRLAWEQAGGFDERLFMYLEDVDLAWRLQLLGWGAVFAPNARLYHHLSATGGGAFASFYVGRNTIWVVAKDMPGPLIRRHLGRIVAAQARVTWDALRAWRGAAARARLRGQLAGLLGLPKVLGWRQAVQASRVTPIAALSRLIGHD